MGCGLVPFTTRESHGGLIYFPRWKLLGAVGLEDTILQERLLAPSATTAHLVRVRVRKF